MSEAPREIWAWTAGVQPQDGASGLWRTDLPAHLNVVAEYAHYIRADIAKAELDAAVRAERDGIRSLAVEVAANTRGPSEYDLGYRDCALFFDAAIRERGK